MMYVIKGPDEDVFADDVDFFKPEREEVPTDFHQNKTFKEEKSTGEET